MSKRTDTIRSLFAQPMTPPLSADNAPAETARVASGAVRSIKETFSTVERENDDLRARLAESEQVREISPDAIDPSPFADRFAQDEDASFETLKNSIADRGQEVPVLLRPSLARPGRYEVAYGHRRVRAARDLARPVRAVVRTLSDDDLVVAQGLENSAREDLSFIERAMFAFRLEEAGRPRSVIQQALAIDKAEASKLISVARAVPDDIVRAIGRAAKTGRPRWQDFSEALKSPTAAKLVRRTIAGDAFKAATVEERFGIAYAAARNARKAAPAAPAATGAYLVAGANGVALGQVRVSKREIRVALSRYCGQPFAEFLAKRLPQLLEAFAETEAPSE